MELLLAALRHASLHTVTIVWGNPESMNSLGKKLLELNTGGDGGGVGGGDDDRSSLNSDGYHMQHYW